MIDIDELKFDKDGLIPAVVVDSINGKVLTVAYMNKEKSQNLYRKETYLLLEPFKTKAMA